MSLSLVSWFCISPLSNVLLLVTESQHADTSLQPRHLKAESICHQIDILMCSSPAKVLIGCLAQPFTGHTYCECQWGMYLPGSHVCVAAGYLLRRRASLPLSTPVTAHFCCDVLWQEMCCEGVPYILRHTIDVCTMDLAGMVYCGVVWCSVVRG